jgi:hypothetical protein
MPSRSLPPQSPGSSAVDREIAGLYGLPLPEFTRARDQLAARLRKAGQADEAEAVKTLKKPTPPVWAINQVARQEPAPIREFLEAVARLRSTQERRRSDELDEATRREREAFARVVELVRQRLTETGSRDAPDTMARVTATLRGAAADTSHHDDLRRGTLKEELRAPGFEVFTGEFVPRESEQRFEKPAKPPRRDESAEERQQRERRERARQALRVAESELEDWRRRAGELEKAVEARRKPVEASRTAVEEAKAHLAEAQDRLKDEERAAEQAEREAERARREAEKAEARLRAAEKTVREARRQSEDMCSSDPSE